MNLTDLLKQPLSSNITAAKQRKPAVIDSETDPFKKGRIPKPFLWGFYDGDIYEEFETVTDLLTYLEKQAEKEIYYRIYAHNGGKFDYHFMLDYLEPESSVMIINGRLSKFNIGPTEYRDSYNLFNFALSKYKKDEIDYSIMEKEERDKPFNKRKISDYLQKDCIYLYELVHGFIETYGMHLTQAGAAMKIWQKMSGLKPETSAHYFDSLLPYYYGGRVECGKKGIIRKQFSVVDITSAYPYAMTSDHPISGEYKSLYNKKAEKYINENGGLLSERSTQCFFKILARSGGCLPYRDKVKNKLTFPRDYQLRMYTIPGWEIQAGIETNTLRDIRIIEVRYWKESINFKEYVNKFFKIKSDAERACDKLTELFAKLFLNALYGKFAANPRNYKTFTIDEPKNIDELLEKGYKPGGFLGKWFLAKRDLMEDRQRFYNIATAASITSFVRAYLWKAICKTDGFLYCDTDSIAAHDISQLELGNKLGEWDLEGEFESGGIGGRKMYAFKKQDGDWKTASKGARLESREILDVAKGKEIIYDPKEPTFSVHHEPRFTQRVIVKT